MLHFKEREQKDRQKGNKIFFCMEGHEDCSRNSSSHSHQQHKWSSHSYDYLEVSNDLQGKIFSSPQRGNN